MTKLWSSGLSTNPNIEAAVKEAVAKAISTDENISTYDAAICFISSSYDSASLQQTISSELSAAKLSNLTAFYGCTSGGVIGPSDPLSSSEPSEIEGRPAFGITFLQLRRYGISHKCLRLTTEQLQQYVATENLRLFSDSSSSPVSNQVNIILAASEDTRVVLSKFVSELSTRENVECVGAMASTVTSLHQPRLFFGNLDTSKTDGERFTVDKYSEGLLILSLQGDVAVSGISLATSCRPVGPTYVVTSSSDCEILSMNVRSVPISLLSLISASSRTPLVLSASAPLRRPANGSRDRGSCAASTGSPRQPAAGAALGGGGRAQERATNWSAASASGSGHGTQRSRQVWYAVLLYGWIPALALLLYADRRASCILVGDLSTRNQPLSTRTWAPSHCPACPAENACFAFVYETPTLPEKTQL